MINLFLSYSTPKNENQIQFLNEVKKIIELNNFNIIEVMDIDDFQINPIFKIINALNKSDAFLCIAFEKKAEKNTDGKINFYTSHWLDIELSLAIEKNLQFFIMMESHLSNNEVLCRSQKNIPIHYIGITDNSNINPNILQQTILEFIEWLSYLNKILLI
jgi:hypothetical protein